MQVFINLKETLNKSFILIYFDRNQILYIDIDTSHKFGLEVILFHDMVKAKVPKYLTTKDSPL